MVLRMRVVKVADPEEVKLIAHSMQKSDRLDAQQLARLAQLEAVPEYYIPSDQYTETEAGNHRYPPLPAMIRSFGDQEPTIASSAYVDPTAVVIGDVTVGPEATILPGAVLRGDGGGEIVLEANANVQDNVTIHADASGTQVVLCENAAVGHNAIVHNATVGEHSLVGMNATVLDDATVEPYSVVAANSLVRESQRVESGTLVGGTPAEVLRDGLDRENRLFGTAARYTERVEGLRSGELLE